MPINPLPLPPDPIAQPRRKNVQVSKPDTDEGMVTDNWSHYFTALSQSVGQGASQIVTPIQLTTIAAAVPTTSIAPGQTAAGLYRLTYYMRCVVPAAISSSLQVTFTWSDHGTAQSKLFPAMTGNITTTHDSQTYEVYSDAAIPMTYALAYASNLAGTAQFEFYLTVEAMGL
jgi:hypothetical protein